MPNPGGRQWSRNEVALSANTAHFPQHPEVHPSSSGLRLVKLPLAVMAALRIGRVLGALFNRLQPPWSANQQGSIRQRGHTVVVMFADSAQDLVDIALERQ